MDALQETLGDESRPTRAQIEEHFKIQFDFARNAIKNYITDKHNSKTFSGIISKITEPFIQMVSLNVDVVGVWFQTLSNGLEYERCRGIWDPYIWICRRDVT